MVKYQLSSNLNNCKWINNKGSLEENLIYFFNIPHWMVPSGGPGSIAQ